MKYRYISDCHVHSDASYDGCDSVVMLCENAMRMNLHALTVTDHFECNFYEDDSFFDSVRKSLSETQKAAILFQDKLQVYRGIEVGQATQNLPIAERVLSEFDFDFVLGSLHNIVGLPDFYEIDYAHCDVHHLLEQYFEQVLELIETDLFDSLAHLTYPLRYIRGEHNIQVGYEVYESHVDSILHALIRKNKALELNASGLRQKIGTTMPCPIVIKRFHELGGKYVTIGSDAHRWADVGSGVEEAMNILKNAGFDEFTVYINRKPHLLPIA
ncbi:MAG: histidinol-phosphatase HisJ family protein [Oscillospiraceae bacterium]|nr:histidinol-phosphatase HisJ family protein [Oscillospiraceae bacterium]